ncbi:LysR family transcriptional regulator [Rhodococcoides kyotonense]|uniref:DNA-binding transcriptional regulator, LysR family n=1 Tax=Rhodococcoides kyotonense TaxID=398843 RepID=A0A239DW94_9NOCA|nr:LysR family transcriptional regulator [Rhodococcus kyotonensis]SNS36238.1 DNA-binding transcriptional regulator, LysR family [Rhodococcus kyotonensis]
MTQFDDLEFFDVVARSASLTEAGRALGMSVSSVSKRLSQLEARLGVRLVQRSTRRSTLTPEGERYAAGVAVIVGELAELEESVSGHYAELRGKLLIHSSVGLGRAHIAPLMADFVAAHPRVEVDVELSAAPPNLSAAPFDIAIRVGVLQDSRLTAKLLCRNRRVVVASPRYLDTHSAPAVIADLRDHNCIVLRQDEGDFALWRFGSEVGDSAIRVAGNMISNDGDIATQWCVEGRGVLMRSLWHVGPMLDDGTLVQLLPDVETPAADIHAVYSAAAQVPRRVRAAVDHLHEHLAGRLHT